MLNKFKKTIHNKYSRIFKFIFFLRYLLMLFFVLFVTLLTIPIFFDYEKREKFLKFYLQENFNLKIISNEQIKYNVFPLPNIELSNIKINLNSSEDNLNVKKIKIFSNLTNIYNFKNFNSYKIIFKDSNLKLQIHNFKFFANQFLNKNKNFFFDNLNLAIINSDVHLVSLKNIKFANYGHLENLIKGQVFGKNFKIELDDNHKNTSFKLLDSGVIVKINFDEIKEKDFKQGSLKARILNSNLKFNFKYDGKVINIFNSHFRNKNISFKSKSEIILEPFLDINSEFIIEDLNKQILTKIDLVKFLKFNEFLKKINNQSEIKFKSKKFNHYFFDNLDLKIDLVYGRMNFSKSLVKDNNIIKCSGSINFLKEFPILYFDCYAKSKSEKEFLKMFSTKIKNRNENFELIFNGNLNILSRKIYFKNISLNDSYKASREDLRYFKNTFETILFEKNFIDIFDLKKIKKFILEIS